MQKINDPINDIFPNPLDNETSNKSPITFLKNYPLVKSFLVGSFSGTFSAILFQPLDLVKTRLQSPIISGQHGGMVTTFSNILQQEHLKGLWRGMVPSIVRCVPGVGLYFCSLDFLKRNFSIESNPTAWEAVMLGMFARSMSGIVLIPLTVIKTRYESEVYQYNNILNAFKEIYNKEGLKGMTCGLVPTLIRDAPFSGLYLMFYTKAKELLPSDILYSTYYSSPAHFSCGLTAGLLSSIVTQPADVLKTKIQLYPDKFQQLWTVIIYVQQHYGIRGFFKGMVPRMLRRTLMASMAWTVYEKLSNKFGLR